MSVNLQIGMVQAGFSSMLNAMKPLINLRAYAAVILLAGVSASNVFAEITANPYQAIIERNPFGLKPPPPPVEPAPVVPVIPPGKVILTGITTLFGRTPRALLEITEQEPGKAATPPRKPILKEGERDGAIEVVSIDIEKSQVRIRNSGIETNITFDTKTSGGAGPAPAVGGFPAASLTAGAPMAPGVFTPQNTAANTYGRGNAANVYGNSGSGSSAPGLRGGVANAGAPSVYGGYGAGGAAIGGGSGLNNSSGLIPLPSRALRTDTPNPGVPQAPVIDPAKQYLDMALDHELNSRKGDYPPLPPMPTR